MDFASIAAISMSGMDVERARLDASALNLANVHTTRSVNGGVFKPVEVISAYSNTTPFSNAFSAAGNIPGAQVVSLAQREVAPRMAYEPGHPDADSKGFVAYPGVDSVAEMVNVMTAVRAYEADVMALNAAKAMSLKALDIGGNS